MPAAPLTLRPRTHTEMAALRRLHRHDRDDAAQLRPAGRLPRADQRGALHARGAARDRVLGRHLRVPRAQAAQAPRGRDVLRPVRPDGAVRGAPVRARHEHRAARHRGRGGVARPGLRVGDLSDFFFFLSCTAKPIFISPNLSLFLCLWFGRLVFAFPLPF